MAADGGSGAGGGVAARLCGAGVGVMAAGSGGSGAGTGDIAAGVGGNGGGTGDVDGGAANDVLGAVGWAPGLPRESTFIDVVASAALSSSARRLRRATSS